MAELVIKIDDQTYNHFVRNEYSRADVIAMHAALVNATPLETVTEFADRCRECGAKYGKLLKQTWKWKIVSEEDLEDHNWYLIAVEGYGTPLKAKYHSGGLPVFQTFSVDPRTGLPCWKYYGVDDIKYYMEMPKLPWVVFY